MRNDEPAVFALALVLSLVGAMGTSATGQAPVTEVHIVATAGAWPSDEVIENDVTPIKVRIENRSGRPLKVRFRDFTLIGSSGQGYAALPLHNVLLTGRHPDRKRSLVAVEVPRFGHLDFRIAPGYREIFPGSEAFPGHFGEDREYTEYHSRHWRADRKPTVAMFEHLLPEGVLGAGGFIDGFLYFQQVDPWDRNLRLETVLADADSGEVFGDLTVGVGGSM